MVVPRDPRYGEGSVAVWSNSSLGTYLRCGFWYRFEVLEGRPRRVTLSMAVGTGVAAGAEHDLSLKSRMIRGATPSEIRDAAVAGYDAEVGSTEHDLGSHRIGIGRDETAGGALAYARDVGPRIPDVIAAEQTYAADFASGWRLVGSPDYITPDGLGDLKTGQPWSVEQADTSRQLTAYAILHRAHYGALPRRVWIDSLSLRAKHGWTHQRLWSARGEADVRAFVVVAESAIEALGAGVFLPAPERVWYCSRTWCPHYVYCPAVAGRKSED
jgi:hypothetical protein